VLPNGIAMKQSPSGESYRMKMNTEEAMPQKRDGIPECRKGTAISARNDLKPKRRGLTISLPIPGGPVVIYDPGALPGEPFKPINLPRSQTLAIIVPPVEPSPKGRSKPTKIHHWHYDVESVSGFCRAHELREQDVDSMNERVSVDFPSFEYSLQNQHLLNYPKTSGEKDDFRGVKQKLSFPFDCGV